MKRYRPSNGTEGEIFQGDWCSRCERDRPSREGDPSEGCSILVKVYALPIDDPAYPEEWTYGPDGQPLCTAFHHEGTEYPFGPDPAAVIRPLL